MGINYLAPAPYGSFITRSGSFQADANGLISNVGAGAQAVDLLEEGCVPLAFNPFANFRNLIDAGDFSINPFQRNIPGIASGGAQSSLSLRGRRRPASPLFVMFSETMFGGRG